jgi:hypothetical protein
MGADASKFALPLLLGRMLNLRIDDFESASECRAQPGRNGRFPHWDGVCCLVPVPPSPLLLRKLLKTSYLFYDYVLDL